MISAVILLPVLFLFVFVFAATFFDTDFIQIVGARLRNKHNLCCWCRKPNAGLTWTEKEIGSEPAWNEPICISCAEEHFGSFVQDMFATGNLCVRNNQEDGKAEV